MERIFGFLYFQYFASIIVTALGASAVR